MRYVSVYSRVKQKLNKKRHTKKSNNTMKHKSKKSNRSSKRIPVIGGIIKNPWIQRGSSALGMGTLAALVASRFSPQNTQLISLGGEYLGGGLEGVLVAEGVKLFAGAPSVFSGASGNGSSGSAMFA